MSVLWSGRVGHDGDMLHGVVAVDYWQPREDFETEVGQQLAEIHDGMLRERDRLMADMERG